MTHLNPNFNDKRAIEAWHARPLAPFSTIEVRRLTPTLGAEVRGIDLSQSLSEAQLQEVRRAMNENLVIAFRDQQLGREQHKAFVRQFGQLHQHTLSKLRAGEHEHDPEVLAWRTDKDSQFTAGEGWHSDVSCDERPIAGSFLHVTRLPDHGGGDTASTNMILAYESLSPAYQAFLDKLTAVHDGALPWTIGYGVKPEAGKAFPTAEHPVVAIHPGTGRKFLYVNSGFTSHIPQLSRDESAAVLQYLFRHIERSVNFQVRVRWEPGTLLFWDNWATQHRSVWDYFPQERWGERVSALPTARPQAAV